MPPQNAGPSPGQDHRGHAGSSAASRSDWTSSRRSEIRSALRFSGRFRTTSRTAPSSRVNSSSLTARRSISGLRVAYSCRIVHTHASHGLPNASPSRCSAPPASPGPSSCACSWPIPRSSRRSWAPEATPARRWVRCSRTWPPSPTGRSSRWTRWTPRAGGGRLRRAPARGSAAVVPGLVEAGVPVVDVGADFRLAAEAYPAWYGFEHSAPEWLGKAVYGLTERARDAVGGAVARGEPGVLPDAGGARPGTAVRGGPARSPGPGHGGRQVGHLRRRQGADRASHFAALDGSVRAYKVGRHQHTPEMEAVLGRRGLGHVRPAPRPGGPGGGHHVLRATRGGATAGDAARRPWPPRTRASRSCASWPRGRRPTRKRLTGTNVCELSADADAHAGTAIVIGAVDNLGKGAAGQAIQNLNLMLGLTRPPGSRRWGCTRERHRAAGVRRRRRRRRAEGERHGPTSGCWSPSRPASAAGAVHAQRPSGGAGGHRPPAPRAGDAPGRRGEQRSGQRRHRRRGIEDAAALTRPSAGALRPTPARSSRARRA